MIIGRDVQKKLKPSQPSLPKQHPRILSNFDYEKSAIERPDPKVTLILNRPINLAPDKPLVNQSDLNLIGVNNFINYMKTFVYEENFQLNGFWKAMKSSNPKLAKFAKKIFTTPATSASSAILFDLNEIKTPFQLKMKLFIINGSSKIINFAHSGLCYDFCTIKYSNIEIHKKKIKPFKKSYVMNIN
ncbi:hypothetical protein BpHYR1_005039 [Brachionus plicatilis]|uniref:HAT C-terminal dimerisation domain-containing protein n=1 Tax=Brachionus plicatilis TaxID=10195 RepID=A0A3M7RGK6_BRAPC|nr:hypothetical protein BpHYR1_005039 [Brachionus plicatilis]